MPPTRKILFGVLVVTSLLTGAMAFPVSAQTDETAVRVQTVAGTPVLHDFPLGPTRFAVPLPPGGTTNVTLELTNREGQTSTYTLLTEDFAAGPDSETPTQLYGQDDGPFSARRWIQPGVQTITLQHGERAFLPVTITVPQTADAGDHYAAVLVQRELDPSAQANGVSVISRVGSLFLITVAGPVERAGDLVSLTAARTVFTALPVELTLTARNDGTVYLAPQGAIEIRNVFGALVESIPVRDWVILRGSSRPLALTWSPSFALGRYRATANLAFGPGLALTPVTTVFWVLPITTILLVVVAVFALSFLWHRLRRGKRDV